MVASGQGTPGKSDIYGPAGSTNGTTAYTVTKKQVAALRSDRRDAFHRLLLGGDLVVKAKFAKGTVTYSYNNGVGNVRMTYTNPQLSKSTIYENIANDQELLRFVSTRDFGRRIR